MIPDFSLRRLIMTASFPNFANMEPIINKVAASGLITISLEDFLPEENTLAVFDLKPFLFREMILREKDFREALPAHDWNQYAGKHVAITCSADAIIPMWAYMLVAAMLQPVAASVFSGNLEALRRHMILQHIAAMPVDTYAGQRIVIKGCGDRPVPEAAFIAITDRLRPIVRSIMYGEPCSTVPVYKQKNNN